MAALVVTLDEYFEGNTDEWCIAPNQWEYGRPPLAEMYTVLRRIQARDDVQAVLVGLHDEWSEAMDDESLWPAAENIHIYTTASHQDVEGWIMGLAADGALEGWPYGMHPAAPQPQPGYKVFTVCWD